MAPPLYFQARLSQPDRDLDLDQFQFLRADAEKLADSGLRHFLGKKHADGTLVLVGQPVVEVPDDFDASFFFFMSFAHSRKSFL